VQVFGEDPSPFLTDLGITLADPWDPEQPAVLDPAHEVLVNHDHFYFGSLESRRRFLDDPGGACGVIRDPVNLERFRPGPEARWLMREGRLWCFSADSTLAAFRAEPDSFVVPRYGMVSEETMRRASRLP